MREREGGGRGRENEGMRGRGKERKGEIVCAVEARDRLCLFLLLFT